MSMQTAVFQFCASTVRPHLLHQLACNQQNWPAASHSLPHLPSTAASCTSSISCKLCRHGSNAALYTGRAAH